MGAFERIYQASHLSYKNKFLETIKSFTGGPGLRIFSDIRNKSPTGNNGVQDMSTFIGNYKDLNGSTVRVSQEEHWYFYEVVDGPEDLYRSDKGPRSDKTLTRISAKH